MALAERVTRGGMLRALGNQDTEHGASAERFMELE